MSDAANVAAIRTLNEEVLNRGRLELIPKLFARDFVSHRRGMSTLARLLSVPTLPAPAHDQLVRRFAGVRSAFPDWHSEIAEIVPAADVIAVRYRQTGTHLGPLFGMSPTGRSVTLDEAVFYRFADGMIREDWAMADALELLIQLGRTDLLRG